MKRTIAAFIVSSLLFVSSAVTSEAEEKVSITTRHGQSSIARERINKEAGDKKIEIAASDDKKDYARAQLKPNLSREKPLTEDDFSIRRTGRSLMSRTQIHR